MDRPQSQGLKDASSLDATVLRQSGGVNVEPNLKALSVASVVNAVANLRP
jgi:hypothetical protein